MISLLFLLATPSVAEFFQYTDQNGNINYTDDVSLIPEDQQKSIIIFESIQNDELLQEPENQPETEFVEEEQLSTEIPDNPTETDLQVIAEELDRMNTDLDNISNNLKAERDAISKTKPEDGASSEEMVPYSEAIETLNAKIEQYEEQRQAYDKKVQAYNERIKTYNAQRQSPGE
jgi:chromosome segregation ATPase